MNVFEVVKENVTARQAAEAYNLYKKDYLYHYVFGKSRFIQGITILKISS